MRRVPAARLVLALGLAAAAAAPAAANFQVRGRFLYTDREFGINGFTGNEPNLPIRLADVEVADNNTNVVLASGATDQTGSFTIQVTDNQTRDIRVRVKSSSNNTAGLYIQVRQTGTATPYAAAYPTFTNHAPTQNIDFTAAPGVAAQAAGGEAFNIYDQALDAIDFIASLEGARPTAGQSLALYWAYGSTQGTYFSSSNRSVYLLGRTDGSGNYVDSDAYDDAVILHEIGHYMEFVLGDSDNPGGQHYLNECAADVRLAWSEGQATFFQNMVRLWKGLARPEIYVDTSGLPGAGRAILAYQVENPPPPSAIPKGSGNEYSVNAVLWDIVDGTDTPDASPGTDDDPLRITDGPQRFWDVETNYLPQPSVTNISVEDFWDGWLVLGKDYDAEMRQIFTERGMEFFEDDYEQDDSRFLARPGGVTTIVTHHTLYGVGDTDWTRFDGVAGGSYRFETLNLPCGSDTWLRLYDSDGTTLLAQNDNRAPGDRSSFIQYTPTRNGALYLVLARGSTVNNYASYASCDLSVGIIVPVQVSDVEVESTGEGVWLRWRGQRETGFSHFDVERAGAPEGPWVVRNTEPIVSKPDDPTLFEYLDGDVRPGERYFYRLAGVEGNGDKAWFGPYAAVAASPARLALYTPRPNPFNPRTEIRLELPRDGAVLLRVYDAGGRLVRTLLAGATLPAGTRAVGWDGTDDAGRSLASGVYFLRLEALGLSQMRQAVLVR